MEWNTFSLLKLISSHVAVTGSKLYQIVQALALPYWTHPTQRSLTFMGMHSLILTFLLTKIEA